MTGLVPVLSRQDLESSPEIPAGCFGEGGLVQLHPKCHPHSGFGVVYIKGTGSIRLTCSTCHLPAVLIEVAP